MSKSNDRVDSILESRQKAREKLKEVEQSLTIVPAVQKIVNLFELSNTLVINGEINTLISTLRLWKIPSEEHVLIQVSFESDEETFYMYGELHSILSYSGQKNIYFKGKGDYSAGYQLRKAIQDVEEIKTEWLDEIEIYMKENLKYFEIQNIKAERTHYFIKKLFKKPLDNCLVIRLKQE